MGIARGDAILDMIGAPTNRIVLGAEVGVFSGDLSLYLLSSLPELRLYMIDIWPEKESRDRLGPVGGLRHKEKALKQTDDMANRRVILHGTSVEMSEYVFCGVLDFVFIDGCHEYESVAADIASWRPKVKAGGFLCGHDYLKGNEVSLAVDRLGTVTHGADTTWFFRCDQ